MPVVQVAFAPSRAEYEKVRGLLNLEADPPSGSIHHNAAELPSGEVQIIDVWESRADAAAFGERIFKAFAEAGVLEMVMERGGPPELHEVIDMM
ncbi:MAG: hypothetical protein NVSMB48_06800 [Marmoricola sp.]